MYPTPNVMLFIIENLNLFLFYQSPAMTVGTRASLHQLFPELKLFLTVLLELFLTGMTKLYLKFLMAKTFSLSPTETQSDLS